MKHPVRPPFSHSVMRFAIIALLCTGLLFALPLSALP